MRAFSRVSGCSSRCSGRRGARRWRWSRRQAVLLWPFGALGSGRGGRFWLSVAGRARPPCRSEREGLALEASRTSPESCALTAAFDSLVSSPRSTPSRCDRSWRITPIAAKNPKPARGARELRRWSRARIRIALRMAGGHVARFMSNTTLAFDVAVGWMTMRLFRAATMVASSWLTLLGHLHLAGRQLLLASSSVRSAPGTPNSAPSRNRRRHRPQDRITEGGGPRCRRAPVDTGWLTSSTPRARPCPIAASQGDAGGDFDVGAEFGVPGADLTDDDAEQKLVDQAKMGDGQAASAAARHHGAVGSTASSSPTATSTPRSCST